MSNDPALGSDLAQPDVVFAVVREVVGVPCYLDSRGEKNRGELQTEVAIRKENNTQAARSYTTACSISFWLSS